jgi:Bacterial Ig-like domain (group 3)
VNFSTTAQPVALSATVTSTAGTVNQGTVTFTILSNTTPIGTAAVANVTGGSANATYTLPAGTGANGYIIQAVYGAASDFLTNTNSSHALTVSAAATTTVAASSSVRFTAAAQTIAMSAAVTSSGGTVSQGTETFTVLHGSTVIGTAQTVSVVSGAATANYTLPAGTAAGTYVIQATYNGTVDYSSFTDSTHTLTVTAAADASVVLASAQTSSGTPVSVSALPSSPSAALGSASGAVSAHPSSKHKAARTHVKINRGPLALKRSALPAQLGSGDHLRVNEAPSDHQARRLPRR